MVEGPVNTFPCLKKPLELPFTFFHHPPSTMASFLPYGLGHCYGTGA
jgi:hypothetical protein